MDAMAQPWKRATETVIISDDDSSGNDSDNAVTLPKASYGSTAGASSAAPRSAEKASTLTGNPRPDGAAASTSSTAPASSHAKRARAYPSPSPSSSSDEQPARKKPSLAVKGASGSGKTGLAFSVKGTGTGSASSPQTPGKTKPVAAKTHLSFSANKMSRASAPRMAASTAGARRSEAGADDTDDSPYDDFDTAPGSTRTPAAPAPGPSSSSRFLPEAHKATGASAAAALPQLYGARKPALDASSAKVSLPSKPLADVIEIEDSDDDEVEETPAPPNAVAAPVDLAAAAAAETEPAGQIDRSSAEPIEDQPRLDKGKGKEKEQLSEAEVESEEEEGSDALELARAEKRRARQEQLKKTHTERESKARDQVSKVAGQSSTSTISGSQLALSPAEKRKPTRNLFFRPGRVDFKPKFWKERDDWTPEAALRGEIPFVPVQDVGHVEDLFKNEPKYTDLRSWMHDQLHTPSDQRSIVGPELPDEFDYDFLRTILRTTEQRYHKDGNPKTEEQDNLLFNWMIRDACATEQPSSAPVRLEARTEEPFHPPFEFVYTNRIVYPPDVTPAISGGCGCTGPCQDNPACACRLRQAITNRTRQRWEVGGKEKPVPRTFSDDFAYNPNGALKSEIMDNRIPIYECGMGCGCPPSCHNRVVGNGCQVPVEIFWTTQKRGWGVRVAFGDEKHKNRVVPAGTPLGIYAGELLYTVNATTYRAGDYDKIGRTYLYDIDCWHIEEDTLARGVQQALHLPQDLQTDVDPPKDSLPRNPTTPKASTSALPPVAHHDGLTVAVEAEPPAASAALDNDTMEVDAGASGEGSSIAAVALATPPPPAFQGPDAATVAEHVPALDVAAEPGIASPAAESPIPTATTPPGEENVDDDDGDLITSVYTIDAFHYGNWTRFVNHRCTPNVTVLPIYVDEMDIRRPLLVMIAEKDIKDGEELSVSYWGAEPSLNGTSKAIRDEYKEAAKARRAAADPSHRCYCGQQLCRGVMFLIGEGDTADSDDEEYQPPRQGPTPGMPWKKRRTVDYVNLPKPRRSLRDWKALVAQAAAEPAASTTTTTTVVQVTADQTTTVQLTQTGTSTSASVIIAPADETAMDVEQTFIQEPVSSPRPPTASTSNIAFEVESTAAAAAPAVLQPFASTSTLAHLTLDTPESPRTRSPSIEFVR